MKVKEAYFRNDMSALKEQQNLQEIKHLMITQEMRRIITAQDQKVKASLKYNNIDNYCFLITFVIIVKL